MTNYLCPTCNKVGYKAKARNMCQQCDEDVLIACKPERPYFSNIKTDFDKEFAKIISRAWR